MPDRRGSDRRGFALLAVLWIVVGLSALALALNLATREAVHTSQNRLNAARARWMAEGCFAAAQSLIESAAASDGSWLSSAATSEAIDNAMADALTMANAPCRVDLRPVGRALDINRASSVAIARTLRAAKVSAGDAGELARAIVAWRDQDGGSPPERAKPLPQSPAGPAADSVRPVFSDTRELHRVAGFDAAEAAVGRLDTLFTTEPGRLLFDWAPGPVLASLPGFTQEAIDQAIWLRSQGEPIHGLDGLLARTSPAARDSLLAHAAEINALTVAQADGWVLAASAKSGQSPAVEARIEARLAIARGTAAVVWWRESW
jgi:type II secretory pathway component PulK